MMVTKGKQNCIRTTTNLFISIKISEDGPMKSNLCDLRHLPHVVFCEFVILVMGNLEKKKTNF